MNPPSPRIALVAGATGDIGRAVVHRLLQDHARVYAVARSCQRLNELADDGSRSALHLVDGDLRDEDFLVCLSSQLEREAERLDALIHCQGYTPALGPIAALTASVLDDVLAINLRSPILLTRRLLPLLRRSQGSVVFLSSVAGVHSNSMTACYGAAKAALSHFARTLAQEEGPAVRSNAVAPGWVESATMDRVLEQFKLAPEAVLQRVPLRRAADPAEVAEMIAWLCSAQAGYVSGGIFPIDGGGQP